MDEIEQAMAGLGDPHPLPSEVRHRLAESLIGREPLLDGIDAAQALPPEMRERLFESLTARRRRPLLFLNMAAVVLLLVAVGTIIVRTSESGARRGRSVTGEALGGAAGTNNAGGLSSGTAGASGPAASGTPNASASLPGVEAGGGVAAGPSGAASSQGADVAAPAGPNSAGPPPPYAFGSSPAAAASPASEAAGPSPSPSPAAPLQVGTISGDPVIEQAFRAYVQLLNANGGVRGRPVNLVAVSPSAPARGVVATVNLSDVPVASTSGPPSWAGGTPLLETLAVPDGVLRGAVFDLTSAPVHQATLAVNEVFPSAAPGSTAVVFTQRSGVLASDVPNAMVAALRAVQVTPIVVPYMPGETFPRADAVFLSLDAGTARSWFADASHSGYRPRLGVTGVYSIAEPSLVPGMPSGTRMLAPYALPDDAERAALAQAVGAAPGMAAVQGWVTAKALAVALWQSGATTAAQTTAALAGLRGYDDGFSPTLAFRQGTNSRFPDAVLMTVSGGELVRSGSFRTDPA